MTERQGPVVVTGIKPTGEPHLGNYLGMIRPALDLAATHEAFVFVADAHAMTTVADPADLARQTRRVAATLLALGLDPGRTALYRQSDVPEVFELAWMLACETPKGVLNRAHAYKAAVDANRRGGRPADDGVSAGLYTYPVLMAADILAVGADVVPVGRDQAQHLEVARDLAEAFNRSYGPVFAVPEPVVEPDVATVAGTDGRKMSKSYDNVIPIFAPPSEVAGRLRRFVTDSRRPEEPKDPDSCPLFGLYRQFAAGDDVAALGHRYRAGGVGYGEVKAMITRLLEERLGPPRRTYDALLAQPDRLDAILVDGAARARRRAAEVLAAARRARGSAA